VFRAQLPPFMPAAPPPPPAAPTLNLLGIVEGNGEAYAVFINTTTHDIVRLKTGEGEDGWVLRSVSGREAVVEKNDRTEVLELPPITGVPK
jgi:general secretion pathway protein N